MTKRKSQPDHDGMVIAVIKYIKENGHSNVNADIPNYNQPEMLHWKGQKDGHIPDITSVRGDESFIFEIETADSISHSHTEDQWKLFSASASLNSKSFVIVIPKDSKKEAENRAQELNLALYEIWTVG